jgi:hypothetical protein
MMLTLGILLFSSLVLMPQFLQTLVATLPVGWACASAEGLFCSLRCPLLVN